jgi:hypothetical protein
METGMPSFAVVKPEDCFHGLQQEALASQFGSTWYVCYATEHGCGVMGCFFGRSAMVLDARYAEMRPDASEGCTVRRWLGLKRGSRVAQGKARQGKQ